MTNAQILTAVILKWGEPVIPVMMGNTLNGISAGMLPVEKLFKSIGLAGPGWQISNEINSLAAVGGTKLIRPFLEKFVSRIPDDMIPELAHGYVDSAIQQGKLSIIDGFITFDRNDLVELKKYLDCNLPYQKTEEYVVKVPQQPVQPSGQQTAGSPHPQSGQQLKNDQREKEEK